MSHAATHSRSASLTESTLHTPSIVDKQKELLKDDDRNWKTLSSSTRFQHMSVKFEEGSKIASWKVVFQLSCSPLEALAHNWLVMSNELLKKHFQAHGNTAYELVESGRKGTRKSHQDDSSSNYLGPFKSKSYIHRKVITLPVPLTNLEFVLRREWAEDKSDGSAGDASETSASGFYMA